MRPPSDPTTADQLRDDIDTGRTGEKVDWSDPAAAPLGTDAEAGGHPPTASEVKRATPSNPEATRRHITVVPVLIYVGIAIALLAVAIAIVIGSG